MPRPGQGQQIEERAQGSRLGHAGPGNVARDAPRRREDRLDGRPVDFQVRSQHEDIGGLQVRMGVEDGEQAIVHDLRLAHRGVADVDLEGIVRGSHWRIQRPHRRSRHRNDTGGRAGNRGARAVHIRDRWALLWRGSHLPDGAGGRTGNRGVRAWCIPDHGISPCRFLRETEIEDVPLHRGKPAGSGRLLEVLLPFGVGDLDQGIEAVASRPPPGREQLVALGEVAGVGVGAFGPMADLAARMDVAPVLPARIEEEEVDVDSPRGLAEQLQVRR